jgi:hypothetical protein
MPQIDRPLRLHIGRLPRRPDPGPWAAVGRRLGTAGLVGVLALAGLTLPGGPAPTARAADESIARPFQVNLYRSDDFSSQATKDMCVAGALQTMTNIMSSGADHSRKGQDRLYDRASDLRGRGDGRIGPMGWARTLRAGGFGRYGVVVYESREAALRGAAIAVRRTGRPAGLLVWRGAHSWVMHGFRATGDPLLDPGATITAYAISDPWFPRVSSIWGRSQEPDTYYSPEYLSRHYLPWRRNLKTPGWDGRFLVVQPFPPLGHWWRMA